ncbi:uncharacterized protein LOC121421633 isoform X2 [Lytechinus variegatus]|uniref:uncharacterized protein LOC121421633 isoform X2 n=1 Tax=Lytechinus variegatus TaxID=7654 RepID=UPI001BB1F3F6|nr:uncharacterized protein LOC121421633 isoform X2 [Lytechinus variegatus]
MNEENMSSILEQEEDHMTGYESIIFPSPRNSRNLDLGAPGRSPHRPSQTRSVIINNAARRPRSDLRPSSWNTNPRSGVIIQHLNSIPRDAERPRIVEVTGIEDLDEANGDGRGITSPDYPVSEPDRVGRNTGYPTLPVDTGPSLPDRDYHPNSDSRPDIHRVNLSAGDEGDPPGETVIPPSSPPPPAPPPPPLPQAQSENTPSTQPPQGNTGEDTENQELHIVLRRALARNFDTTQPNQDEAEQQQGDEPRRVSNFTQTRHDPLQSTQVQTTLERPSRRGDTNERQSDNLKNTKRSSKGMDQRSQQNREAERRSGHRNSESFEHNVFGPRFHSDDFHSSQGYQPSRPRSRVETDDFPRRSSRIIEQIIITREIDPSSGHPMESVPMHPPSRPQSGPNIVYNNSVRESGRRSRGWGPFGETHRQWSPRDGNEHLDLTGIVAGIETDTDAGDDFGYSYGYMPGEVAGRRGRTNQGYDVSPPEERRRPEVTRMPSGHSALNEGFNVPPPPPYTERDVSPPNLRSAGRSTGHPLGRSSRRRSWLAGDSDRSSTITTGWTQRTRVVFAVMLLLCILLLLGLVVVVCIYFTAGPGKDCLSTGPCEEPSIGYIIAFAVIGFLAFIFMLIGIILCCFACRISREKRMQNYPVSVRR